MKEFGLNESAKIMYQENKQEKRMEEAKKLFESYFCRSFSENTMYVSLSPKDEIIIGNICNDFDLDFAIGSNHFTLYEKEK